MNFDQISGQTGYLILNQDGAILSSGGDLENDERTAGNIFKLIAAGSIYSSIYYLYLKNKTTICILHS